MLTGSWLAALAAARVPLRQLRLRDGVVQPGACRPLFVHSCCLCQLSPFSMP
jgi:hypothetical protein